MSKQQESSAQTRMSIEEAVATYAAASVGDKTRMRNAISDAVMAAVGRGDMEGAMHYKALSDAIKAFRPATEGPDFVAIASDLAATYEAAAAALRSGIAHPTEEGVVIRATQPGTADDTKVSDLTRISARKSGKGDVIGWVSSVVTDKPATIAELRGRWVSTEGYPTEPPSSGAIGAAFKRIEAGAEAPFKVVKVRGVAGAVTK